MNEVSPLAVAVRDVARRQSRRARNVFLGEVVHLTPMKIDLHGSSLVLNDDEFELSAWVLAYDDEFGIAAGDNVLLMEESGGWVAFDIVPDKTPKFGQAKSVSVSGLTNDIASLRARVTALEGG